MTQTKESYNHSALRYQARFESYETYREQIAKFIVLLPEKAKVLDIGCGPGINSRTFLDHGFNVTGIDFSEEMTKLAEQKCPEGVFITGDITSLKITEKFDALCASFIIVHLADEEAFSFLDRLPSLIKSKGSKLYLSFMTGKKAGYETTSFSEKEIFFNYFDKSEIIKHLEDLGFSLLAESSEPYKEDDGTITEDIFLIFGF